MSKNKNIKIKYFDKEIDKINKIDKGDWIDLRAAKTVELKAGDYALIPLGVGMILPEGYEAHVVPRSSTFKNYGVLQTNSMGVIDNSYCGEDDQWYFPAYATRVTTIHKNDRICQFRIQKKQPEIEFEEVEHLDGKSRGGFGSTGVSSYEGGDENDDFDDDDYGESEIPNNEYEAVDCIFYGFEDLYANLYMKTRSNFDRDDIKHEEHYRTESMMRAFEFLAAGLKEFSEEEHEKRERQISSMAKCFIDILRIDAEFDKLEMEDVGSDVISKFGKVCSEISDVFSRAFVATNRLSEIGSADEFREEYTKAVQGLTDILGENNILATQGHIDSMVVAYEFYISTCRDAASKEERYEGD